MTAPSLLLLLTLAVGGCVSSDTSPAANAAFEVTDSAGVRIIRSTNAAWGPEPAYLDSAPLVRIASEESGPYQFTFVAHGVLLADGRIAVSELGTSEARIYSTAGAHLQTLGGRGNGPGEFQQLSGLFDYRGDSLLAYDQRLRRTTVLPLDGGTPRVLPNPADGNLSAFGLLDGTELLLYNPGSGYRPDAAPGLQWDTTDIVSVSLTDGSARVITRLASRQQFVLPDGNTRPMSPLWFAVKATSDRGFYWATPERYDIRRFSATGQLQQILRRPVEPAAIDPTMIERWRAAALETARQMEGEAALEGNRRRLEQVVHGTRVPLFQEAFVDRDGRLWMGESAWPAERTGSGTWSLFDTLGVWLGDVRAPASFRALDSRGDRVLGVWSDEDDVPHVQVRRLMRP